MIYKVSLFQLELNENLQKYEVVSNNSKNVYIEQLKKAFQYYNNEKAQILVVCNEFEGNIYEQKVIEWGLLKQNIKSIRKTLKQLLTELIYKDNKLFINDIEIGLVYFRYGYDNSHYENEDYWKIREIIELSKAVSCPSVTAQLINFKKIQEKLQDKQILQRFLNDKQEVDLLHQTFAKIWSLDQIQNDEEKQEMQEMVMKNISSYVLKTQDEGASNNFFDQQIVEVFKQSNLKQIQDYILMQKIKQIPQISFSLRDGKVLVQQTLSELGIFSGIIYDKNQIYDQQIEGYLVRTKNFQENQGGTVLGHSMVDSYICQKQ